MLHFTNIIIIHNRSIKTALGATLNERHPREEDDSAGIGRVPAVRQSQEDTSNIEVAAQQSKPSNLPVCHEKPPRFPSADPERRKHSKPSSKKASKEKKLLKLRKEIAQRKLELARAEAAALESDDDSENSSQDGENRVTEWLDKHPEVTTNQ
ncbi:unnamed protein product [Euphydryas editha]|uniref:Uncharacterized protein n=1 Tax=Euphydryas editha TaxID=104508 RepID=A0AAU9UV30_EUPED|nr:unnamed protein product [Euphydryas editha]